MCAKLAQLVPTVEVRKGGRAGKKTRMIVVSEESASYKL